MLGFSLLLDTSHIDTVEIASSSNKHWKEKEEKIETFFEIVCYQVQSTCIIYRCEDQMIIIRNIKTCRRFSLMIVIHIYQLFFMQIIVENEVM